MIARRKYFKTEEAAKEFAQKYNGDIYFYSEDSDTKFEYVHILKLAEEYFDENLAELYPYCVSYFEEENS